MQASLSLACFFMQILQNRLSSARLHKSGRQVYPTPDERNLMIDQLYRLLGMAVFERIEQGQFRIVGELPDWWSSIQ